MPKAPPGFESLSLRQFAGACAPFGDVAQLGERLVRNEEVGGSSPLISKHPSEDGFGNRARRGVSGALSPAIRYSGAEVPSEITDSSLLIE